MSPTFKEKYLALERLLNPATPYLYNLAAAIFFSTGFYFIKQLKGYSTAEIVYARSIFHMVYIYFFMTYNKMEFYYKDSKISRLLVMRGLLACLGIPCNFGAFVLLPLSEATVINQISPVFIGILSVFILKTKYELPQLIVAILCISGVILIAKPTFLFGDAVVDNEYRTLGVILGICGSFIAALVQVLIKKIGLKTNMGIVTFYFGLFCCFMSAIWIHLIGSPARTITSRDLFYIVLIGIFMFLGQILINRSLIIGVPSRVTLMGYVSIIYTYILDVIVLGLEIDNYSLIGTMLIFSCVFIFLFQSLRKE